MQVNLLWGQLCWAMHDLAIKAPLTNVTLFGTMHSHTIHMLHILQSQMQSFLEMNIILELAKFRFPPTNEIAQALPIYIQPSSILFCEEEGNNIYVESEATTPVQILMVAFYKVKMNLEPSSPAMTLSCSS